MDNWENLIKHHYLKKSNFYSDLNKQNITDADYAHTKRVCKDFEIKKFRRTSWFVCSKQYIIVN